MGFAKLVNIGRLSSAIRTGTGPKLLTATSGDSLIQNVPLLYDANGNVLSTATRTGNTTNYITATAGAKTSGYYPKWDASGNLTNGDSGGGGGGGGSIYEWTVAEFDAAAVASPLGLINGDQILLTDGLYKVYWIAGAPVYYYGSRKVTRPPSSGWSWDNQGTATIDSTNGYEYLKVVKTGVTGCRWRYRTAPAAPYCIKASLLFDFTGAIVNDGTGLTVGPAILFRESGTGKAIDIRLTCGGSWLVDWSFNKWTTSTSFSAAYDAGTSVVGFHPGMGPHLIHLAIENDDTNLKVYLSIDGLHWHQFGSSRSKTNFMAGGPDQVGFGAYTNATTPVIALIDWTESVTI